MQTVGKAAAASPIRGDSEGDRGEEEGERDGSGEEGGRHRGGGSEGDEGEEEEGGDGTKSVYLPRRRRRLDGSLRTMATQADKKEP